MKSVTRARSQSLVKQSSYTLVLENLVLPIDLVTCTLEKERKESSIVAAAYLKAIGTIP